MVNDKNHLYTKDDLQKDNKEVGKRRTQQSFSQFSFANSTALNDSSLNSVPQALQIDTQSRIGQPLNDTYGTVGFITQAIFFDVPGTTYNIFTINGDVAFAFEKIPEGRHVSYTIDFVVDTTTPPVITWPATLLNPPELGTLSDGERVILFFKGVIDDVGTRFTYIGGTSGGGSGDISEPIELGFNEAVTQTLPTLTTIDGDIFNPTHVVLDKDISLDLVVSATTGKYKSLFIIFDTDGSGFTVTWPSSVLNPPIINDSIAQRISVILYTINNGTAWTHATSGGSSTGGEFFGPWTANHDAGTKSLINLAVAAFVDTSSVSRGSISGDSATSSLLVGLPNLGKFRIQSLTNPIADFEEAAANVFRLNMLDHAIINAKDIAFDVDAVFAGAGSVPTIGYEASTNLLHFNVPTGKQFNFIENNASGGLGVRISPASGGTITCDVVNASDVLQLGVDATDPTAVGEIRSDGTDIRAFSGGTIRNFSDIGPQVPQSSIVDGNTTATVIDTGPTFIVQLNAIQKFSVQNTRVDFAALDLHGITQLNFQEDSVPATPTDIATLTPSTSGLLLNIISTSDFYDIKFNNQDAFHVDNIRTRILSTSPNTLAAVLSLFRDDASPTNNDDLGLIKFDGRDSGGNFTTYGELRTTIENVTNGSEAANFFINLKQNNLDVDMLRIVNGVMVLRTFDPGPGIGANFTLLKEDPAPGGGELVGNINWNVFDDPTETTYARIQTFIVDATDATLFKIQIRADNTLQDAFIIEGNDNSTQFQYLTSSNGNTRMQAGNSTVMGYFVTPQVTDFSINIGTSGTLEIPQIDDGNPSLSDLNSAGGAFDGAIVHDINDGNLYIRNSSSAWDFYTRDGQVT